jgi:hypothetical protein
VETEFRVAGKVEGENKRHQHGPGLTQLPDAALAPIDPGQEPGSAESEESSEHSENDEPEGRPFGLHLEEYPHGLIEDRGQKAQQAEHRPAPPLSQKEQTDIEHQDVAEQTDGVVGFGRQQQRGGEAAGQTEHGDDQGSMTPGECAAGDGYQNHEAVAHTGRDKTVEPIGRPEGGVENDHARSGQGIGLGDVAPLAKGLGAPDGAQSGDDPRDDSDDGWDQTVLDGVL